MISNNKGLFFSVVTLFVLSGIASLIYQVVWFKQLSYFLGNTTYAQSVVLATFMGGLSIGAWFFGKKADHVSKPLKVFALLEVGIGVYCFLYFLLFDFVEKWFRYVVISNHLSSDSSGVLLMKIVVSISLLLFPAVLMGGTLPVLVKVLSLRINQIGRNVAILYSINSLGAVIGSILAGFYLIEWVGLKFTAYIGATTDLSIGLLFLMVVWWLPSYTKDKPSINYKEKATNKYKTSIYWKIALLIAGVSGLCAMIYEVVWLRLLIPIFSSTTYSFTLIITVFIAGITIGSLIVFTFFSRVKNHFLWLGICQLLIVVSLLLTIPFYDKIPYLLWSDVHSSSLIDDGYSFYLRRQFYYASLILLLPTIFLGMTLPLATKVAVDSIEKTGTKVGRVFAINTVGTVLGALLGGLLFIPFIGILKSLELALILNLLMAVIVFVIVKKKWIFKAGMLSVLVVSSVYYLYNVNEERWAYTVMTSEVPRKINRVDIPPSFDAFYKLLRLHRDEILYYKEGLGGTIVVTKKEDRIALFTNGKGDAHSTRDLPTQITLGHLPVILHEQPDTVMVIGMGAGMTIGSVLEHNQINYAEVAEISGEVIEASSFFNHVNGKPLQDSRLKVIKDDGVSALRLSPYGYDLIISQPSNPWSAGVGNLFTVEFFEDCKHKLNEGGYLAQWFNLYEIDDEGVSMIINTVKSVFDHIQFWQIGNSDILILASDTKINPVIKNIEKHYNEVSLSLENAHIKDFASFLSQQIVILDSSLDDYLTKDLLNTEDKPLLELIAPKAFFLNKKPDQFIALDQRESYPVEEMILYTYLSEKKNISSENLEKVTVFQYKFGNKKMALQLADEFPSLYATISELERSKNNLESAYRYIKKAVASNNTMPEFFLKAGKIATELNKQEEAKLFFDKGVEKFPTNGDLFYQRAQLYKGENNEKYIENLQAAVTVNKPNNRGLVELASIYVQRKQFSKSIALFTKAIKINDNQPEMYFNRGASYLMNREIDLAINDFSKTISLDKENGDAYYYRAKSYLLQGNKEKACQDLGAASELNVMNAKKELMEVCR